MKTSISRSTSVAAAFAAFVALPAASTAAASDITYQAVPASNAAPLQPSASAVARVKVLTSEVSRQPRFGEVWPEFTFTEIQPG